MGEFLHLKDKELEGDGLAFKRFEKTFFFSTFNTVSSEDLIQINIKDFTCSRSSSLMLGWL